MNTGIIQAAADKPLPDSVEWMPAGAHRIFPKGAGKDGAVVVCVEGDAARLDEQLQAARAEADAGKRSRLFVDFNHEGKAAAAIPTRFFWRDGIRLAVEWTAEGAAAIAGRVFSYFSPEWYPSKDGHPEAIPPVGALGSLVNTPAFQTIERLAAAMDAPKPIMDTNTLALALGLPGTATEAEILANIAELKAAADAEDPRVDAVKASLSAATAEAATIKAAHDATITELSALKAEKAKRNASDCVTAAISSRRLTEASREKFEAMHISDPSKCAELIASMPPRRGEDPVQAELETASNSDAKIFAEYSAISDSNERQRFLASNRDAVWRHRSTT